MSTIVVKPFVLEADGVFGQLRNGAIINIGGTANPTFTVGGRGLLFDDGSSTAPGASGITLQSAYNTSPAVNGAAQIILDATKDFQIVNGTNPNLSFTVDATTGKVTVAGPLDVTGSVLISSDLTVTGLINGIDLATMKSELDHHLAAEIPYRHLAGDIDIIPIADLPGPQDVQGALEELSHKFVSSGIGYGYEHIQFNPALMWLVVHNLNSRRAQVTVYDMDYEQVIPERIKIVDENTIMVDMGTDMNGRAMVIAF